MKNKTQIENLAELLTKKTKKQKEESIFSSIPPLEKLVEQIPQSSDKKEKYIGKPPYPDNILYYIKLANIKIETQKVKPLYFMSSLHIPLRATAGALSACMTRSYTQFTSLMTSPQKKQNLYILMKFPMLSA